MGVGDGGCERDARRRRDPVHLACRRRGVSCGHPRGGAWEPRAAPYPRHPHTAIGRPQGIAPTWHPPGRRWKPRAAPYPRYPHTAIGRPQGITPTWHPSAWASRVHTSDSGRPRQVGTFTLRVVRGLWSGLREPQLVVSWPASLVGSLPGSADSEEKECSWAYSPPFSRRSLCLPVSVTRP